MFSYNQFSAINFILTLAFPLGRVTGTEAPGHEIHHGFQQRLIGLLASHQHGIAFQYKCFMNSTHSYDVKSRDHASIAYIIPGQIKWSS